VPLSEVGIGFVARSQSELSGFQQWVEATKAQFGMMELDWSHQDVAQNCALVIKVVEKCISAATLAWSSTVRELTDKLKVLTPPLCMLENPKVLTDIAVRKALSAEVNKLHGSKLLGQASDFLLLIKQVEDTMPTVKLTAKAGLQNARKVGKLAIGVNWAIDMILNFKPNQLADLHQHALSIKEKFKMKGMAGKDSEQHTCQHKVTDALTQPLTPGTTTGALRAVSLGCQGG
jgi:hypothetical protein